MKNFPFLEAQQLREAPVALSLFFAVADQPNFRFLKYKYISLDMQYVFVVDLL